MPLLWMSYCRMQKPFSQYITPNLVDSSLSMYLAVFLSGANQHNTVERLKQLQTIAQFLLQAEV
jgi:hypothetical protein